MTKRATNSQLSTIECKKTKQTTEQEENHR